MADACRGLAKLGESLAMILCIRAMNILFRIYYSPDKNS